jgi:hypothetical protein
MKQRIEELLTDYHPAEIGRLVGMNDKEAKKIIRELYFDWGYVSPEDWTTECIDDQYVLFTTNGIEWLDEEGEYRCFGTKEEALNYLKASLKNWHKQICLNTYS